MKAIINDTYGTLDDLKLRDVAKPKVGARDVLVAVRAAGVDRGVWHLMTGLPYLIRAMGYGLRKPKTPVPGMDVAGTVEAVGSDVTRFRPGDEVFGICDGTYAEYVCTRGEKLAAKPINLSFIQAAAVPVSALTALQAVRDETKVRMGDKVLIIGASGGVGTFAVQIAKIFGAEVTGVCSTKKADLVRSIGADHIIDYEKQDVTGGGQTYDAIIDIGGNRPLGKLRSALMPKGTLVIVGGEKGGRWLGGIGRNLRAVLLSPFVSQRLRSQFPAERLDDLLILKEMIEAGKLVPVVDRSYALTEAPQAIHHLEQGRARGKLVLTV